MARPIQRVPRYIDPNFPIPAGLVDAMYEPLDDVSDEEQLGDELEDEDEFEFIDTLDEPDDAPGVPEQFTVISQTARFAPDGSRVVDIIVEVEDIIGITKYDVRKTKVQ